MGNRRRASIPQTHQRHHLAKTPPPLYIIVLMLPPLTRPPRQNLHDPSFCTFRGSCSFTHPV
ncbi:uncharacterized protein LY79DRAFT_553883, partial [Colletotrichum navitas]